RVGFQLSGDARQQLDWTLAETQTSKSEISQRSLSSAATNRVLQLDGQGSYVALPGNIFTNLPQATVECWVKWNRVGRVMRVLDFGKAGEDICLGQFMATEDLWFQVHQARTSEQEIRVPNALRAGQWLHLAVSLSNLDTKLYVNGGLVGTIPYSKGL